MIDNIENILFDLDGTLTDPKEGITKSIQYALNKMGLAFPSGDELEWSIGPPLVDVFKQLLGDPDQRRVQQAVQYYRERYVDYCAIENKPYEGIHASLKKLVAENYKLYLATSKPWVYAKKILDHFKLSAYFVHIHGSELDGTRDYKEDLIRYILEKHNLKKTNTLMVGDRHYDIHGAKQNQIRSMAVTYGYGSLEEIISAQPDLICHKHEEFSTLIAKVAKQFKSE